MTQVCQSCSREFNRVGSHWSQSDCGYPELTEDQKDLLRGLLMSDGTVEGGHGTGRMTLEMTCEPFLEWVDQKLGVLSTGVSLKHTAEEKVEKAQDDEYVDVVNPSQWKDAYVLKTRRHPFFNQLRSWYSSGQKRFPETLVLTPILVKAWYCGDGSLKLAQNNPNNLSPQARFYTDNESDRIGFISSLFGDVGLDARTRKNSVTLTVDSSRDLFSWMGSPPPGMEYKWPTEEHYGT